MSKRVLIISISEIYHNPRLIKAADEFQKAGYQVEVNDIILGNVDSNIYKTYIASKPWKVKSVDISKRNLKSKFNFYVCSLINLITKINWKYLRGKQFYQYFLCKGLFLFSIKSKPSIIYTNVIDTLPFCVKLKNKLGAKLIFDSQELFSGQYQNHNPSLKDWVVHTEKKYIHDATIVLTTTNVMGERLKQIYPELSKVIRVRNLPNRREIIPDKEIKKPVKLIWHGYAIYLNSRGIKLILEGIQRSVTPISLTLQGNITDKEKQKIISFFSESPLHKLLFKPQAPVDNIVHSLLEYDFGIIGEQAENENQLYTSSNKLFDYLHAGLPVISTAMPGIIETLNEGVGITFNNADELGNVLNNITENEDIVTKLKHNVILFSKNNIWHSDFKEVINEIEK